MRAKPFIVEDVGVNPGNGQNLVLFLSVQPETYPNTVCFII